MPIQFEHFGGTNGRRLFFLVHGMDHTAADLAPLKAAIRASFPDDRLVLVTYPALRWSNQNPLDVAKQCVDRIQSEFESGPEGGYQEIVLVGHSLGALIARKVCLLAHGICSDFAAGIPVTPAPRSWANRIKRLVLLAGMSRGWKLWPRNQHTPRFRWIGRGLQFGLARIFGQGRLVRAAHRGSPFVVNLRLDWLALINGDYTKEMPRIWWCRSPPCATRWSIRAIISTCRQAGISATSPSREHRITLWSSSTMPSTAPSASVNSSTR